MKNALIDFVDAMAGLTSAEDRWNEAVTQSKLMGLDAILVGEGDGVKRQIYWMNTNMPEDWHAGYCSKCRQRQPGTQWGQQVMQAAALPQ